VRAEPYGRTEGREWDVPTGVGVLTCGVDVQGDRLEPVVLGHGAQDELWVIAWEPVFGDPGQLGVWNELTGFLRRPWHHESGATLKIEAAAIDANYHTDAVHRFCERFLGLRLLPTIGRAGRGRPLLTRPGMTKGRRRHVPWVVGTDSAKDMIASRLRITTPGPGYVHFPETLDSVFYDQLTAEKLVTGYVNKVPVRQWVKIEGRRNEVLDCTVLALAALASLGPVARQLAALAEKHAAWTSPQPSAPKPEPKPRFHAFGSSGDTHVPLGWNPITMRPVRGWQFPERDEG
jgi:phage terminase large subunit GpA-like protein